VLEEANRVPMLYDLILVGLEPSMFVHELIEVGE
jgi:hypothetical protein